MLTRLTVIIPQYIHALNLVHIKLTYVNYISIKRNL